MRTAYDALLFASFGGPEAPADVVPFLENVVRGTNVPPDRLVEVASHYQALGGASPINQCNRDLIDALQHELRVSGIDLPIYFGNRKWDPLLVTALRTMAHDGVERALAFVTSAFGSYSGCRAYTEDIERARAEVGDGAPQVDKLRLFFNHPGFIEACAAQVGLALAKLDDDRTVLLFTAHSIPQAWTSASPYVTQVREACRLVAEHLGRPEWQLAWQSRSGPPQVPWLAPGLGDHLAALAQAGAGAVLLVPIGFVSDHMEVAYDLDRDAIVAGTALGMRMARADTVGTHPRFVMMIRELVEERLDSAKPRAALGTLGVQPDACPTDCCPTPRRRGATR